MRRSPVCNDLSMRKQQLNVLNQGRIRFPALREGSLSPSPILPPLGANERIAVGDFRFIIDPALRDGTADPAPAGKPNPLPRDRSFQISGGFLHPIHPSRPAEASASPARSEPDIREIASPGCATTAREPLLHIAVRIPRKLLMKIDEMARQDHTSLSEIVRQSLARTVRRRQRSTGVLR
jgi:hypothetical protein